MEIPQLKSGDVELRLLTMADAAPIFALVDKNRAHLRQWLPWVDAIRSVADEEKFGKKAEDLRIKNEGVELGIFLSGSLAGKIGMSVDSENKKATVGYWLGSAYQGRGIMTTAVRLMLRYAFGVLKLNRVEILCAVGNTKSCAVPERLGFTNEGVLRQHEWLYDHFVDVNSFSMLASEWKE